MSTRATPDRRRALTPADPARRAVMRPVLDAWIALIGACRARNLPIIYTTPVSRADGADVVLLPTESSASAAGAATPRPTPTASTPR